MSSSGLHGANRCPLLATAVVFAVVLTTAGCSGDDAPTCIEVSLDCNPLYQPTFDNVYSMTLDIKCGIDGPCHNSDSVAGGMIFENADDSFDLLQSRVVAGEPGCSSLVHRLDATDGSVMPPRNPLTEQERCSVRKWIADGAAR